MDEKKLKKISNIMSVFALIFGVLGIVLCCNLGLGIVSGIIAINLSACSLITRGKGNKFAFAGIITGLISIVLGSIYIIVTIIVIHFWGPDIVFYAYIFDFILKIFKFIYNLFH